MTGVKTIWILAFCLAVLGTRCAHFPAVFEKPLIAKHVRTSKLGQKIEPCKAMIPDLNEIFRTEPLSKIVLEKMFKTLYTSTNAIIQEIREKSIDYFIDITCPSGPFKYSDADLKLKTETFKNFALTNNVQIDQENHVGILKSLYFRDKWIRYITGQQRFSLLLFGALQDPDYEERGKAAMLIAHFNLGKLDNWSRVSELQRADAFDFIRTLLIYKVAN